MLLNEIANSKPELQIYKSSQHILILDSTIGKRLIRFSAAVDDAGEESWVADFREKTQTGNWTYLLTKSGNEFQVTSFIVEAMRMLLDLHAPRSISFTADTKGRGLMYKRVVERFFKSYTVYIRAVDGTEYELKMVKN